MIKQCRKLALFSLVLISSLSQAAHVQPFNTQHIIVTPTCLLKSIKNDYTTLSTINSFSLIAANNENLDQLIAAKTHRGDKPCGGFVDVTDSWKTSVMSNREFLSDYLLTKKSKRQSYAIKYEEQTNQLIKQINPQIMWTDLTTLSSYPDRYAGSDNGVKTAAWIKTEVEKMAKDGGHDDVTVYYVQTGNGYRQPSVVAKVGNSDEPGIVIGGHMDTLSSSWEKKPGADDDGSGTVTVLGVARTILASGMHFKKPLYFIWYAAEEEGLVGSGFVVKDFQKKNIPVDAVMQLDMTGYANQNDPTIWLITDNINRDLTNYLETLVTTYVKKPVNRTRCGYSCSDHASWNKAGFAASFPFEASFGNDDPYIHTAEDTMDVLSLDHITDFAKLGIAFAVELAEPVA